MTRLFNLESYIDCCSYARLFHQSPEQLIPQHGDLPRAYKAFVQKYASHHYVSEPISGSTRPQNLEINSGIDYLSIGTQISQGDKEWLFIIPDTVDLMTLSMSHFLEHRDGYVYSSAYHYWNHYSEIYQHKLIKPLVFVDLDSFGCDRLIPIDFHSNENSSYPLPILNIKEPIVIKSGYQGIDNYNNICQKIAQGIVSNLFPDIAKNLETVNHLANYLQKTSFILSLQPYVNKKSFDYIIEILHNHQIFYKKVTLSIAAIAGIVSQAINIQYLHNLASTYPQYQFALITQYKIFSSIQQLLPEYICLNPIIHNFDKIWQEKSLRNFPLFGIYLDKIEFAIGNSDNTGRISKQWIQLSDPEDAISYEGKSKVLIGRIPSINQDFFRIPKGNQTAKLPIRVNGNEYCRDGIPQDYHIEIENQHATEDICIRIEFNLQPGSFPKLLVTDIEGKYKITTSLTERIKLSYNHIPSEEINSTRHQKSLSQINRLQKFQDLQQFKIGLSQLSRELDKIENSDINFIDYTKIRDLLNITWKQIHKSNNQTDLLLFVNDSSPESAVTDLKTEFKNQNLHRITAIICRLLNSIIQNQLTDIKKDFLVEAIIFIGKTYKYSQYLSADELFKIQFNIANKITHRQFGNEYLQCLARVALTEELQRQYFNRFNSYYTLETSQYLWGYGRVLLWYFNFDSPINFVNYREHFRGIIKYLLGKAPNDLRMQYKQNAFLSLLYLLTFRHQDTTFCQPGSDEMRLAERVINHFKDDKIILIQVSQEKTLNRFFQEMIEGTATEDDVASLVHC